MVQETRKPPRRRLGVGDRVHPEENMEDGLSNSCRRTPDKMDGLTSKARIKTATSVFDRSIHKLCLIATKEELN